MLRLLILLFPVVALAELSVDIDFPGGSGVAIEIDQDEQRIVIDPSDFPGKGWRCWWYFKVSGLDPNAWSSGLDHGKLSKTRSTFIGIYQAHDMDR